MHLPDSSSTTPDGQGSDHKEWLVIIGKPQNVKSCSHPTRENNRKLNAHELYVIGLIIDNQSLYSQ